MNSSALSPDTRTPRTCTARCPCGLLAHLPFWVITRAVWIFDIGIIDIDIDEGAPEATVGAERHLAGGRVHLASIGTEDCRVEHRNPRRKLLNGFRKHGGEVRPLLWIGR